MSDTITKQLKWVFLIHFIAGMVAGIAYFLIPELYAGLLGWTPIEPAIYRLVGAAMIGFAFGSLLAYRDANWVKVKIVVEMEIVWLICADIALIMVATTGLYPPLMWASALGIMLFFTIAFIYCYIRNLD